jgi:hypothetical protein
MEGTQKQMKKEIDFKTLPLLAIEEKKNLLGVKN